MQYNEYFFMIQLMEHDTKIYTRGVFFLLESIAFGRT